MGFSEGKLPVKYLGVPLIPSKLSKADCQPIIDKVQKKFTSWSARKLTYAGRLQLLSSVVFHFQVYWSNIFLLPKGVIHNIDMLCRKFLWSGQITQRAMSLVSWETVCTPKNEGGLSLKQLAAWNKAACGKLIWKIVTRQRGLWTRWVESAYLCGSSFWNIQPKANDPWFWKKLLKLRHVFLAHLSILIGDGRQTSLFYDPWIGDRPLESRMDVSPVIWGENLTVNQWTHADGSWNIPHSFARRFPALVEEIQTVALSDHSDQPRWNLTSNGKFSVSSFYEVIRFSYTLLCSFVR